MSILHICYVTFREIHQNTLLLLMNRNHGNSRNLKTCGCWSIGFLLLLTHAQLFCQAPATFDTAMRDLPTIQLEVLAKVWLQDHPGFPTSAIALGDINGDGYDDIGFTSVVDTVFIFYGGNPMDDQVDGFVLGGTNGAVAADFNGDGVIDLATAASNPAHYGEPDPMRYGKIRVYFGSTTYPYFGPEPDVELRGTRQFDDFGINLTTSIYTGLMTLDINGDGSKDLMFRRRDWRDQKDWEFAVILGGPGFDTTVDVCIQEPVSDGVNRRYGTSIYYGDLNGDSRDDLIVYYSIDAKEKFLVYISKSEGSYWEPDFVLEKGKTVYPTNYLAGLADVNGDGYCDIITGETIRFSGYHLFMGSEDFTSMLESDSIPIPQPDPINAPKRVYPVGDMNGDGRDDFILGWSTILFERGLVYMVYPAGPFEDWKQPIGTIGILPDETGLEEGAFPVGDVNGDGYHDFAILGQPTGLGEATTWRSRFWIIGGSPELRTDTEMPAVPDEPYIYVYPNPVNKTAGLFSVRLGEDVHAPLTISIANLLGQKIYTKRIENEHELPVVTLNTGSLPSGAYMIEVITESDHYVKPFINQ
ncbi:MAG: T9SS type A sorting domain-containing protein [Bacteroidota bacterium]